LIRKISYFLVLFCGCLPFKTEFVQVMDDHDNITKDTCKELITDINSSLPDYNKEDQRKLSILSERLQYMIDSSHALHKYVVDNIYDEELLLNLIKLHKKINMEK